MRDFRTIRKFENDWKKNEQDLADAKAKLGAARGGGAMPGGGFDLESLVDQMADSM